MRYYIPILFVSFLFLGCTPSSPKISEYVVNVKMDTPTFVEKGCSDSSLKIGQAFSSNSLMLLAMNYGLGDYQQLTFSQSLWSESPNKAITSALTQYIKSTQLFKNVQIAKSRSRNNLLLEINIEDFKQYFSEDEKSSYVNISIDLTLLNLKTGRTIETKTFESKEIVEENSAKGGVIALNKALQKIFIESGIWLSGVCR
ncbi:MAG: ABC-type transport auxiliary lipoprotein family protein [Campylobacterota bacterium]|nr:ABC-type transport auxiliary lipoprotein family protein [Campylobacterota bacterium]